MAENIDQEKEKKKEKLRLNLVVTLGGHPPNFDPNQLPSYKPS